MPPSDPALRSGEAAPDATPPIGTRGRRAQRNLGSTTSFRVVMAGPVGVGKTTAVRTLSGIETIETEVPLTLGAETASLPDAKTTTTVGLDYGVWKPTEEISVALIGTPGQERFAEARASFNAPWTRALLWLYGDSPTLATDAESWIGSMGPKSLPRLAIALTRTADGGASGAAALRPVLERFGAGGQPVLAADPRDRDSVIRVVSAALDLPEAAA